MLPFAAADVGAAPTIPLEVWAFTILTLTAGIATALKGRYGWLAVGLFLLGLPWLVSSFLLARPRSAWATALYGPEKLSTGRAQGLAAAGRVRAQLVRRPRMRTYVRALGRIKRSDRRNRGGSPGYQDAVVRRFDAPEALDTRFYEVHAKSALNRVPQRSRMPFPWTINPYRGCSHACTYCLGGDTRGPHGATAGPASSVTSGPGTRSTAPCGAARTGATCAPRCSTTGWSRKPAYRVTLENGTELITSGDHRFLTEPRVEARDRRRAGPAAAAAPDAQQQADGHRCVRRVTSRDASTTSADTSAA